MSIVMQAWTEYLYSMHILGENTLENAKRLGYLDAKELYPDIPTTTLEECAKAFYALPEPAEAYGYNDVLVVDSIVERALSTGGSSTWSSLRLL